MKRVLVTGAGGFVGARILDMWRGKFALCAFPSDALRTADESAVLRFILKEHPDVIVHTAALSNTQYCQQEPEDSFRANVLLPEWVAKGAEEVGAKLLSCSSAAVSSKASRIMVPGCSGWLVLRMFRGMFFSRTGETVPSCSTCAPM